MRRVLGALLSVALLLIPSVGQAASDPVELRDVVAKVQASVISISVVKREPSETPGEEPRLVVASGSGFAIRHDGYILSNAHVLDHALFARIQTSDGHIYRIDPEQIWADPVSDIAVAKVNADLRPVTWADEKEAKLGDTVFAMGSPFGPRFQGSVSRGIVSGFNRNLDADYTFIQTDAPINPGNSGGPLFNMRGEVVGVNARGILGGDGMGFAIPADVAKSVGDRLIKDGKIDHAWLGLRFEDGLDVDLGLGASLEPVITLVEAGGPAEKSGLQVGDTILQLNRQDVGSLEEIGAFLRSVTPGTPVLVSYKRGESTGETRLVVATRPHDAQLFYATEGLWTNLTTAQAERARVVGQGLTGFTESDVLDGWTARTESGRAVLWTEYLTILHRAREAALRDAPLTASQTQDLAAQRQGGLEVQVDLPVAWKLGPQALLWAEWRDSSGTLRAESVQLQSTAPPGYQRLLVRFRSRFMEHHGFAELILHLDENTDRRFGFDLDSIH